MDTNKKMLPIGIDNFEKLREENFYYVDKTGLIRDLLYNWGEVNLFTSSSQGWNCCLVTP